MHRVIHWQLSTLCIFIVVGIVVRPCFQDRQVFNSLFLALVRTILSFEVIWSNLKKVSIDIIHGIDTNTIEVFIFRTTSNSTDVHDVVEPVQLLSLNRRVWVIDIISQQELETTVTCILSILRIAFTCLASWCAVQKTIVRVSMTCTTIVVIEKGTTLQVIAVIKIFRSWIPTWLGLHEIFDSCTQPVSVAFTRNTFFNTLLNFKRCLVHLSLWAEWRIGLIGTETLLLHVVEVARLDSLAWPPNCKQWTFVIFSWGSPLFTIFQDFFWTVPCVGSEVTINKFDIFISCTIKGIFITIYSNVCVCAVSWWTCSTVLIETVFFLVRQFTSFSVKVLASTDTFKNIVLTNSAIIFNVVLFSINSFDVAWTISYDIISCWKVVIYYCDSIVGIICIAVNWGSTTASCRTTASTSRTTFSCRCAISNCCCVSCSIVICCINSCIIGCCCIVCSCRTISTDSRYRINSIRCNCICCISCQIESCCWSCLVSCDIVCRCNCCSWILSSRCIVRYSTRINSNIGDGYSSIRVFIGLNDTVVSP